MEVVVAGRLHTAHQDLATHLGPEIDARVQVRAHQTLSSIIPRDFRGRRDIGHLLDILKEHHPSTHEKSLYTL